MQYGRIMVKFGGIAPAGRIDELFDVYQGMLDFGARRFDPLRDSSAHYCLLPFLLDSFSDFALELSVLTITLLSQPLAFSSFGFGWSAHLGRFKPQYRIAGDKPHQAAERVL